MIYLFYQAETEDGNYAHLGRMASATIEGAIEELSEKWGKEAEDYGYFESAKSRLIRMAKEYKVIKLLRVTNEKELNPQELIGEIIKKIDDNIKTREEEKERAEYERLKAKFGDK